MKEAFKKYVDKILNFFNPLPPGGQFYLIGLIKYHGHFNYSPLPPLVVYVVFERSPTTFGDSPAKQGKARAASVLVRFF